MTSYHYFGSEACEGYHRLISVNFNRSALQIIGRCAFYDCTALKEIEIPSSVTTIEDHTFYGCRSLTRVRFHDDGLLTTIGAYAFQICSDLTDISIPSSVGTIKGHAFCGCKRSARVSFQEGLKIIESFGFEDCTKLEYVGIPGSFEVLDKYAFCGCASLREVNIEAGNLRVIGSNTFFKCYNLKTINIPSTVERIESSTFEGCQSLEVLMLRNGLKFVGERAFYFCKNLQAVELPQSLETIDHLAFGSCLQLVTVRWEHGDTALTIHNGAFWQCALLVSICLPSECRVTRWAFVDGDYTAMENQYGKTGMPDALFHRFDNFPMHKKCYQASFTTTDELAREIQSSRQLSSQTHSAECLVDPFGMTPFHVLLSGGSCRNDLLQVLLASYPPDVLGWKDVHEYLTQRRVLDEDSRNMLRMTLEGWLVGSILSWKKRWMTGNRTWRVGWMRLLLWMKWNKDKQCLKKQQWFCRGMSG